MDDEHICPICRDLYSFDYWDQREVDAMLTDIRQKMQSLANQMENGRIRSGDIISMELRRLERDVRAFTDRLFELGKRHHWPDIPI